MDSLRDLITYGPLPVIPVCGPQSALRAAVMGHAGDGAVVGKPKGGTLDDQCGPRGLDHGAMENEMSNFDEDDHPADSVAAATEDCARTWWENGMEGDPPAYLGNGEYGRMVRSLVGGR